MLRMCMGFPHHVGGGEWFKRRQVTPGGLRWWKEVPGLSGSPPVICEWSFFSVEDNS